LVGARALINEKRAAAALTHFGDRWRDQAGLVAGLLFARRDTFALLASQAGGEAAKTMRNMSEAVASQVGDAASGVADTSSDLATSAKQHAKTFASELEAMARRNPLGTIAGTLVVGIIIGLMSRGRGLC
jgi:ElaB/YqjD/DUF883 family membrane-anchored ribosome-binding protein